MKTNYLNLNSKGIYFDYEEYESTPWMCGCGNDLTAPFGAEDICEYPEEEYESERLTPMWLSE